MRKGLGFVVLLIITSVAFGQQVSNVNFDYIKEKTTDSTSELYYPALEKRLVVLDTTLDMDKYEFLYYGYVFTEKYSPYNTPAEMELMREKMNEEKYREAIPIGWEMYRKNPVSIDVNYKLLVCYHRLDIADSAKFFARNYFRFLEVIYRSGDGKSINTAYVVDCVNDEYHLLSDMGLDLKHQSLVDGPCDKMDVKPQGKDTPDEFRKIKVVYFNVSKPFETLNTIFDE